MAVVAGLVVGVRVFDGEGAAGRGELVLLILGKHLGGLKGDSS